MSFPFTISLRLSVALAALLLAGAPDTIRAAGASPFAGAYCFFGGTVIINNSGRLAGEEVCFLDCQTKTSISGRVANDGSMELTVTTWARGKGWRVIRTTHAVGVGALDENGSLYGWLDWDDGGGGPFLWFRCD